VSLTSLLTLLFRSSPSLSSLSQVDEGKILKVVLVNLSQRHDIDMWPVYVDQKGAEGKTTLCVAMI
jgi:hypothetical protein